MKITLEFDDDSQLDRARVRRLMDHLDEVQWVERDDRVVDIIAKARAEGEPAPKIVAIKGVRAAFNLGLKEAKELVDKLWKEVE